MNSIAIANVLTNSDLQTDGLFVQLKKISQFATRPKIYLGDPEDSTDDSTHPIIFSCGVAVHCRTGAPPSHSHFATVSQPFSIFQSTGLGKCKTIQSHFLFLISSASAR